jgi:hypothetical protein
MPIFVWDLNYVRINNNSYINQNTIANWNVISLLWAIYVGYSLPQLKYKGINGTKDTRMFTIPKEKPTGFFVSSDLNIQKSYVRICLIKLFVKSSD